MEFTKKDVVVIALGSLRGATEIVDTEDIAIAAHALAPSAFGWRKHTEQIDLDLARTSLRHEKESAAPRVDGSVRTGWHLTETGRAWLRDHAPSGAEGGVKVAETPTRTQRHRAETGQSAAVLERVRSSPAFRAWSKGEPVNDRQAAAVFRIDEYTPQRDRRLKTARISDLVQDNDQLSQFMAFAVPAAINLRAPSADQPPTAS